jgi:hypothetical protein
MKKQDALKKLKRRYDGMARREDLLDVMQLPRDCDDVPTATHQAILTYCQKFCGDHWGITGDRTNEIDDYSSIVIRVLGDNREAAQALLDLVAWVAVAVSEGEAVTSKHEGTAPGRGQLATKREVNPLSRALDKVLATTKVQFAQSIAFVRLIRPSVLKEMELDENLPEDEKPTVDAILKRIIRGRKRGTH